MSYRRLHRVSLKGQRGIAIILLVLFVGLVLLVTVAGTVRAVRYAQEATLSAHAATPAQATAWNAAENIRRYLDVVDPRTVRAWANASTPPSEQAPMTLTLTRAGNAPVANMQARIIGVTKVVPGNVPTNPQNNDYRITAELVGTAGTGTVKAATSLEVVYDIVLPPPVPPTPPPPGGEAGPLNFFRDVNFTGDMHITGAANASLNVLGDVTISSTNLTGLEEINTTGTVQVNSAVRLQQIHANEDVYLTEGADAQLVRARGDVLLSGGGMHGEIYSNQSVTFHSSEARKVYAKGELIVGHPTLSCLDPPTGNEDGTYIGEAKIEQAVWWYSCGGGAKILYGNTTLRYHGAHRYGLVGAHASFINQQQIRTLGDMDIRSAESVGFLSSKGNIRHDTAAHPPQFGYCARQNLVIPQQNNNLQGAVWGYYGGAYTYGGSNTLGIYPLSTAPSGSLCRLGLIDFPPVLLAEVPEYTRDRPRVDVRPLRSSANLIFERSADGLDTRVTVQSLNGVPDDTYVLAYAQSAATAWEPKTFDVLCRPQFVSAARPRHASSGQPWCAGLGMGGANPQPIWRICETQEWEGTCYKYNVATSTWTLHSWAQSIPRGVTWFEGNLTLGSHGYVNTFLATGNITVTSSHRTMAPNYAGYNLLCANAPVLNVWGQALATPTFAGRYPTNLCNTATQSVIYNKIGNLAFIAGSYDPDGTFRGGDIHIEGGTRIDGSVMAGNEIETLGNTTISGHVMGAAQGTAHGPSGDFGETLNLNMAPVVGFTPGEFPCMGPECAPPPAGNQARMKWSRYR
jgi:hypothetical protein